MTELFLIESYREAFSEAWSNLQWWASVSFGLIALASFAKERLNLLTTIGLSILYCSFTAFSFVNTVGMLMMARGATEELSVLRDLGEISSVGLRLVAFNEGLDKLNRPFFWICFISTFTGTLAYLWFAWRKESQAT